MWCMARVHIEFKFKRAPPQYAPCLIHHTPCTTCHTPYAITDRQLAFLQRDCTSALNERPVRPPRLAHIVHVLLVHFPCDTRHVVSPFRLCGEVRNVGSDKFLEFLHLRVVLIPQ
jgi:hypothetical protein